MKKITIILTVLIAMTIKANAQIPNSGFENRNTFSGYVESKGWATTYPSGMYTVTQSIDHFPISVGDYFAKIECNTSFNNACALDTEAAKKLVDKYFKS